MQPITQANLDPKLDDIRHLRAKQDFYDSLIRPSHPKTTAEATCWTAIDHVTGGVRHLPARSESGVSDIVSLVEVPQGWIRLTDADSD